MIYFISPTADCIKYFTKINENLNIKKDNSYQKFQIIEQTSMYGISNENHMAVRLLGIENTSQV